MLSARSKVAVALGACLILSGCADYLARRDSVTFGVGNAPEANEGIQAAKAFPPNANNTTIQTDGTVVERAQRNYGGITGDTSGSKSSAPAG